MHIVLLTHYFPPEVNAPANRGFDHARIWREAGHRVTVVTAAPNHPHGRIYPGYRNRWTSRETIDGIEVVRIWTWLAANAGTLGRTLSFVSYFLSVLLHLPWLPRPDIVVSTSPQFFCGLSGALFQRRRVPWVLEIRDLWPESIVAVGAMRRSAAIRLIERIEAWAYARADLVVSVTKGFVPHIRARRGRDDIAVIRNGVMAEGMAVEEGAAEDFRERHGIAGQCIATYLGTHGMAHSLDTVLDAAHLLRERTDIIVLLIGDGAEKARLDAERIRRELTNVLMLNQQSRAEIPAIWAATDIALVTLKRSETFLTVLPSKMFEAMATATPIILAVDGEARAMLEEAQAGHAIVPEDARALASTIEMLADDPDARLRAGENGKRFFARNADRRALALEMLNAMTRLIDARQ